MAEKKQSIWKNRKDEPEIRQKTDSNNTNIEAGGGKLDNFVQQNSPVNNELIRNATMNDLYNVDVDGQMRIMPTDVLVRGNHGSLNPVYSMCSFSYEDDVDLEILNKNGRYKITGYDRRVYNAVGTLYLSGRTTFSLTELFSVMNGYARSNPSKKQLDAAERSLNKFQSIKMYIDLTQEVNSHMIKDKQPLIDAGILKSKSDRIKSAVLEDNMLHYSVGTITSVQGKTFRTIHLIGEPSLLTYNRAKGTLISIPMEYIGLSETNATEKVIAFQDYLLMRIMSYKAGKLSQNVVRYDTLYEDSGVEKPENRTEIKRDRESVRRILQEWVEKGLIASFEEIKEGNSYAGVRFCTDSNGEAASDEDKSNGTS